MESPDIDQMTREELDELAETLNIKSNGTMKDETVRQKIRDQLGEPSEPAENGHAVVESLPADEKLTIVLNDSETDKWPVQVYLNGRSYIMQRNRPVTVPKAVVEILNHAVKTVWDSEMKSYTKVQRYPYRLAV